MAQTQASPDAVRAGVSVARVRELYASGRIDVDELERLLEKSLLQENRRHPVPEGWEPLERYEHEWIDITTMGDRYPQSLCAHCGEDSDTLSRPHRP